MMLTMSMDSDDCAFLDTDPHERLGLHSDGRSLSLWRPGKEHVSVTVKGHDVEMKQVDHGLFQLELPEPISQHDYFVIHESGLKSYDPYAFAPTFSRDDEVLFSEGKHPRLFEVLGGRVRKHCGVDGVAFAVWAPCARKVALIGDFNGWNEMVNPMRQMGSCGIWELFIPGLKEGEKYKFAIYGYDGKMRLKADPFAFQGELRPKTASVVSAVDRHQWQDKAWMDQRKKGEAKQGPVNIYEMHLGSWKKKDENFVNYREVAPELAVYLKEMGYTHIELLPIMGHPLDESWGYQVTGYYAITGRYGSVEDFQFFVDSLHQQGIGVILDWVPGHFPKDEHFLAQFDGTFLFEHLDPRQGYHPVWDTHIFNYGRTEVRNFLIGSALFYLEMMHVDGLRVDAVSSIVFLDYDRKEGEWLPNTHGGPENLEGIAFLQELNREVHEKFPGVMMIAEKAYIYPGVTSSEGLGFDFKWGLGWFYDSLPMFQVEDNERSKIYPQLLHTFDYASDDKQVLSISHDEVVDGKQSLLEKMEGNEKQKFANLRLFLSYMICYPGKKLLFMGAEFGQSAEWDAKKQLDWDLLLQTPHKELSKCASDLNHFYLQSQALWGESYKLEITDYPLLAYRRGEQLFCIHNFSHSGVIGVAIPKDLNQVLFSTNSQQYGGCDKVDPKIAENGEERVIAVPPLTTLILK